MTTDPIVRLDLLTLWHPCTQMKDHERNPPVRIVKGRGVWLYDAAGRRYLDAVSSWWVNLFGHSNPCLNRALINQTKKLEHVIFAGITHDPAVKFARELVKVVPRGLSRVFFADNGSSAVEVALKMSFQFFKQTSGERRAFVALKGGYHGETVGALSVGGLPLYRKVYAPLLMDVRYADAPCCHDCTYGKSKDTCGAECFIHMEKCVAKAGAGRVSAIIIEPLVQCANGMNMYPPVYLKKLARFCKRAGIHLIADEVAVGFGRTGTLFACQQADVTPDFLCLSKGITGGYMPFSAVVTHERIYKAFYADYNSGKAFLHSHSYTGNPLACALALEVLRIFRNERVLKVLRPKIRLMGGLLRTVACNHSVRNTRQTGMIAAFDIVNPLSGKPFPAGKRIGRRVAFEANRRGVWLRSLGDTLYWMPPLSITEKEMRFMADVTLAALKTVIPAMSCNGKGCLI